MDRVIGLALEPCAEAFPLDVERTERLGGRVGAAHAER
jgi:hypothetical protein